jgi:hypothetical protein
MEKILVHYRLDVYSEVVFADHSCVRLGNFNLLFELLAYSNWSNIKPYCNSHIFYFGGYPHSCFKNWFWPKYKANQTKEMSRICLISLLFGDSNSVVPKLLFWYDSPKYNWWRRSIFLRRLQPTRTPSNTGFKKAGVLLRVYAL